MRTQNKILLIATIIWIFAIKVFFLLSFYSEFWTVWKYSDGFFDFYWQAILFVKDFMLVMKPSLLISSLTFGVLLWYFFYTYLVVVYNKLDKELKIKHKKHAIWGTVFTFLGFGCVACGQTLLYSLLLLFGSGATVVLSPIIGQIAILVGIIFLGVGIYRNLQMKNDTNVCRF